MSENGRLKDSELAPTLLGGRLRHDAADAADRMFTAFGLDTGGVLQAVSAGDLYRDYETQVLRRRQVGNLAAIPGQSNHGWGIAGDLANGMNSWGSSSQAWFEDHGATYGWVTPDWANPASPYFEKNEPWHKEYDRARDRRTGAKIRRPKKGEIGIGASGPDVTRIQILLNQQMDGPNLVVDGRFGLGSAVMTARYQKLNDLAIVGAVGGVTQDYLEGRVKPKGEPVIYLQRGTKKREATENLQEFLKRAFPRVNEDLIVDGVYGGDTETAVKHWQMKADMAPTGKIGEVGRRRLLKLGVDL